MMLHDVVLSFDYFLKTRKIFDDNYVRSSIELEEMSSNFLPWIIRDRQSDGGFSLWKCISTAFWAL